MGIGIGSSRIGYEGFVQPRKGQGEAETKSVYYNDFVGYSYVIITYHHQKPELPSGNLT